MKEKNIVNAFFGRVGKNNDFTRRNFFRPTQKRLYNAKTNDKVYYFAHKKLRIFDEFLRKNVGFLKNSESKRTAEFYCTTV